jgi:transposase-like protein
MKVELDESYFGGLRKGKRGARSSWFYNGLIVVI